MIQQGKYVQDNYESGVITNATVPYSSSLAGCLLDPSNIESDPCYQQWLEGEGPYASGGASLNLLFRSSVSNNEEADIHFFGSAATLFQGFYPGYTTDRGGGPSYFSWSMVKMQTGNAAGTITLRSNDPRDTPIINFNYFEQQADQDLQALEEGFEFAMDLFGAIEEEHGPFDVIEPSPSTSVRQSIMDHAFGHHVSSSCRMGPKDDPEYCVDSKFKVNGVDGLRVVDASIFPRTPGAFIVGPTFIASQKAFEAIQEELDA
jgi:choline dehydrogenase